MKYCWSILSGLLLLFGIWITTLHSFLLFHGLAEVCSVVVAVTIFVLVWNLKQYLRNNYIVFIGIAYLFVTGIDFIHSLAYKGMGVFQTNEYKRGQLVPFAVFLYTKLFFWSIMFQFLLNKPCSGGR